VPTRGHGAYTPGGHHAGRQAIMPYTSVVHQEARHDAKGYQEVWHDAMGYQEVQYTGFPIEWHTQDGPL